MSTATTPTTSFDYRSASQSILKSLRRDRDRQIMARRFGFDMQNRHTLEQIGKSFGITRERVRQIEKTTLAKISQQELPEVLRASSLIRHQLEEQGGVALAQIIASSFGAASPAELSYITFLATLSLDIAVIDEDDQLRAAFGLAESFSQDKVRKLTSELVGIVKAAGKPQPLARLGESLSAPIMEQTLLNLALISKQLAHHDGKWGLMSWPEVNPKSIRDKTYLVLTKHGKPMHFSEISDHIKSSTFTRRDVTVQAVHNELIKDGRFILIGRGIYALAEWGYAPGTVADIIIDVLREEAPLHKDEIVKRVLKRRQVKTTTIILNLQEKDNFVRVAKATYTLKDKQG